MDSASGASKGASKGGGASSVDAGEDSESESESSSSSSSSSSTQPQQRTRTISDELESFRSKWKEELKKGPSSSKASSKPSSEEQSSVESSTFNCKALIQNRGGKVEGVPVEEQAKHWFLQGVGLERKGDLYDAVKCYRRAVQLVPDIEYRVGSSTNPTSATAATSETSSSLGTPQESDEENDTDIEDEMEEDDGPLVVKFLKIIEARGWNFFVKQKDDDGKLHLNDLPVEVLSYILRWVVSNDLDVRSLDLLSNTCRGFYCLCRDEKIWELACEKVWSDIAEGDTLHYSSYREMFLTRPRVRFDGCYICKVTYIRAGEQSFQDQSYRPWHFVEYYRYIRFMPDGEILFLTTSDEPSMSVSGLRDAKYPRNPATMRGKYHLYGDNVVSAVVKKTGSSGPTPVHRGRNAKVQTQETTTFHMEFEISPVRNRANWMLKWMHYSVYISRCPIAPNRNVNRNQLNNNNVGPTVTSSTFDLNPNKFPPLYFSRVKSYTQKSEGIL